ncbi:MAG TPA: C13 family peptidase [Ramlibacter sp.]|jgi:hypothetical protein|uniref:C13 family peptidase n=1 Tax=Ramlibacter sp. TaxID=1917967 RepID=UPI002D5705F9|nr:C13 family peptidase [Ramlibacter sp.]HZY20168.1 C13 family peptidase [Ramlibacter sp.]
MDDDTLPATTPALHGAPAAAVGSGAIGPHAGGAAVDPGAIGSAFGLRDWLREGARAGLLRRPRLPGLAPTPWQLVALLAGAALLHLAVDRLVVPGPAEFSLRGWLVPWCTVAAAVLLVWCLLWRRDGAAPAPGVAGWFALAAVAGVPVGLASQALSIAQARGTLPAAFDSVPAIAWGVFFALIAWQVAVSLRIGAAFGLGAARLGALALGMLAIHCTAAWQFEWDRAWSSISEPDERPRLQLSQETFEEQQALWSRSVQALPAGRPGTVDVYGIVFAPYAQDVFLRESAMVADVLAQRFDAQDRVLRLVNHATTAQQLPWATPANLQRAVAAVARRMDRDEDVLVVYLTSHGGRDARLAANHWPLSVAPVTPQELRRALDEAGIRHRVVAVSACYSGSWVEPLADEGTLVMTAADATHTSYGCGRRSELTFFGRALFDEELRRTHSFEQAFAAAVPVIRQREVEAGKEDGFSNPQIRVGAAVAPVLDALSRRLDGPSAAPR